MKKKKSSKPKYRCNPSRKSEPDVDAADELILFANNDSQLYHSRIKPIMLNLARKMKKGVYAPELAAKGWQYLFDDAAKKYQKEFGDSFDAATRRHAAKEFEKDMRDEVTELAHSL